MGNNRVHFYQVFPGNACRITILVGKDVPKSGKHAKSGICGGASSEPDNKPAVSFGKGMTDETTNTECVRVHWITVLLGDQKKTCRRGRLYDSGMAQGAV